MDFYIYENWRADGLKARIHAGGCGHCNYGKGQKKEKSGENGEWHGPFADIETAEENAKMLGDYSISYCKCSGKLQ